MLRFMYCKMVCLHMIITFIILMVAGSLNTPHNSLTSTSIITTRWHGSVHVPPEDFRWAHISSRSFTNNISAHHGQSSQQVLSPLEVFALIPRVNKSCNIEYCGWLQNASNCCKYDCVLKITT